jgi:hypothetical protein
LTFVSILAALGLSIFIFILFIFCSFA